MIIHMHFDNKNNLNRPQRIGSRCILMRDNQILMSYETMTRQWMIPGGGLEEGETLEECCIREMSEEAGVLVSPRKKYLTIIEYFDHMNFVNHYYLAEYVRDTERSLTENELAVGMEPRWIDLDDMIKIFSKYEQYNDTDQLRSGLYRREYKALSCLKALIQNKLL